ncbi:hypothetical protein [Rhodoferax sp.]|uniref:hypothetical protein n=1 Tax=Rhodoferax sp. TaxID=50421 RepID=UPI00374D58E6
MSANSLYAGLESGLSQVEHLLDKISVALIAGEPMALETSSTALRQAMAHLSTLVRSPSGAQLLDKNMRKRLEKVSQTLAQQRSNLIRRAVVVDRALATVLPQTQSSSTYSGGIKASAYRGGGARIYASVAT